MDPPTIEPSAKQGLINVKDFAVKGEAALDRLAAGRPGRRSERRFLLGARARIHPPKTGSSRSGGVLKGPMIVGTIEGSIDSGTRCA